ncbi:uncharacterized protein LOC125384324 [Haliotis rufescens]|uniref:uncharacterized protein LOC125384324 n=1 Tax=Haliotis rufescens TaxID=6454 RepID=UPI00201F60B6|nr:uncharacterized protein LOC125384324 [Haliotis rufescens]
MNRELCNSRITDMIPELVDVALTCHGAYTPALPMSACNDNTDLGQEPDGAMDIFGHNNVNPVIKMFPKLISMLEWNIVSIFHDYGMAQAVTTLSDTLSSKGIKAVTYIIDGDVTSDASYRQLLSLYNNTTAKNRNLLIMCQVDCFNKLLKQANVFDKRNQNRTAIWKFSKWLIYQENVSEVCLTHDLGIDNLALVTVPLPKSSGSFSYIK